MIARENHDDGALIVDAPWLIGVRGAEGGIKVWCKYCKTSHNHSDGCGHRVAHCYDVSWPKKSSPYKKGGYFVCIMPEISRVVSNYVKLERKGKNYFGFCPFHEEATPSFSVNKQKQIFYCFGCGTGGTVLDFVMQYKKCDGLEAMDVLIQGGYKVSSLLYEQYSSLSQA